jgi:hypothetical protein
MGSKCNGGGKYANVHRALTGEAAEKPLLIMIIALHRETRPRRIDRLHQALIMVMVGITKCRGNGRLDAGQKEANQDQQSRNHPSEPGRPAFRHGTLTSSSVRSL